MLSIKIIEKFINMGGIFEEKKSIVNILLYNAGLNSKG